MKHQPRFSRSSHLRRGANVALQAALGLSVGAAVLGTAAEASAQAFPFPSSNISNGTTTTVLTSHELRAQYDFWRDTFIEFCGGNGARMVYPESGNDTRSEGVGYGMVIAAYFGDQQVFDGLWQYYQNNSPGSGLMHWRRQDCGGGGGGGDTGSAADADIDAAFGLIVADKQWPNQGYGADASGIIGAIRTQLFQGGCQGILLAGSQFAACGCINPSYIPPGYYPAFAEYEQAGFWNTARTNTYGYLNSVQSNQGLVPAWSQANGNTPEQCPGQPQVSGGGQTNQFQADAARTPWRVATDYIFTGNNAAQGFLQDMASFATNQRIVHIVDVYNLNGQPAAGGQSANGQLDATGFRSTFTMGGFATAMTASSQENLDRFTAAWQTMYLPGDNIGQGGFQPRAFNSSLALLYGLVVTGYMWDPIGPNPGAVPEPPLQNQPGNLLDNGDFDEGARGWLVQNLKRDTDPFAAEGFAMHQDGEMHLVVERAAAAEEDTWQVRMSQEGFALQGGTNYLISFRARADAERTVSAALQGINDNGAPLVVMGNRRAAGPITLTTEMRDYEWVFQGGNVGDLRFQIDVGGSDVDLVIDDVFFGPTDRPLSVPGELAGQEPDPDPGVDDPADPAGGGDPVDNGGNNGGGNAPPGSSGGLDQTVPDQGDGSGGGAPPPSGGGNVPTSGGMPQPPGQPPSGVGATDGCTVDADCGGTTRCSPRLNLCYDQNGYVWSPQQNAWTTPPVTPECDPYVFWPRFEVCYDPVSGWVWNTAQNEWQYWGDNYSEGVDSTGSSGCAVSGTTPSRDLPYGLAWLSALGLSAGVWRRRRRSA